MGALADRLLESIVKTELSLSVMQAVPEPILLESIVKTELSLSKGKCASTGDLLRPEARQEILPKKLEKILKTNNAACYAVFRAPTAKAIVIIKTNLKRTRDNQYGKA